MDIDEDQKISRPNWVRLVTIFNYILLVPSVGFLVLGVAFSRGKFSAGLFIAVALVCSIIYAAFYASKSRGNDFSAKEKYIILSPLFFLLLSFIPMMADVVGSFLTNPFSIENIFGLVGALFYLALFFIIIKWINKRYIK